MHEQQKSIEPGETEKRPNIWSFFSQFKLVFSNKRFILINAAYFFLSAAIISPHMFLPSHLALRTDLEDPKSISIALLGISNIVGQILVGLVADMYRKKNWLLFSLSMMLCGTLTCFLPFLSNIYFVYGFSILFGFLKSVDYVLQSTLLIESGLGLEHLMDAFGWLQLNQAISVSIGTFILGYIKRYSLDYGLTFITSGGLLIISGFFLLFWPCFSSKPKYKYNPT